MLRDTLADSAVNICLHTAMRCNNVVNSVIYQVGSMTQHG